MSGIAVDSDYEGEDKFGKWVKEEYTEYKVHTFNPTINLFKIPENSPESVKTATNKAFALFFSDPDASANRVRVVVEHILTDQGVKKSTINKKGKRQRLDTHARIVNYKTVNLDMADKMLAIKFIGNDGSHEGEGLERKDLLPQFELLESILNELYGDSSKRLKKLAKQIIKKKGIGRRPKIRRRF